MSNANPMHAALARYELRLCGWSKNSAKMPAYNANLRIRNINNTIYESEQSSSCVTPPLLCPRHYFVSATTLWCVNTIPFTLE
eukprot:scaffold2353_cov167-Amphora_coffeaeformis.AAC.10